MRLKDESYTVTETLTLRTTQKVTGDVFDRGKIPVSIGGRVRTQ